MYGALGGNPWAAMPSLHFATSTMAAISLSEAGRVEGAVGWGYALTLGFALVYLGEHYVTDLVAGAGLVAAVRRGEPLAEPAVMARKSGLAPLGAPRQRVASLRVSPEDPANGGDAAELPIFTPAAADPDRRSSSVALLVGIYFLFPKLVGLGNALGKLDEADPVWIAVAIGFNVVAFATYIALFKAVVGGDALRLSWGETYEINMAGLAATLLFSAGGAGGIALTYWALRKAGMRRHDVGPPDGRLPHPALRLLPAGADRLRRPAADRGAARQGLGRADDRAGRRSPGVLLVARRCCSR